MDFRFEVPIANSRAMARVTEWRPGPDGKPVLWAQHYVDLAGVAGWMQKAVLPLTTGSQVAFQIEILELPKYPDPEAAERYWRHLNLNRESGDPRQDGAVKEDFLAGLGEEVDPSEYNHECSEDCLVCPHD